MSTFTVSGDWSLQGCIRGRAFFVPESGSVVEASIVDGVLSATLPVIAGAYLVKFANVTVESGSCDFSGIIPPFHIRSGKSGDELDLFDVANPRVVKRSIYQ